MNIDDTLRKILFGNSRGIATRPKDYDIILDEKGLEESITQIKQLFLDVQFRKFMESTEPFKKYMTGEEFYNRFEKEVKGELGREGMLHITKSSMFDLIEKAAKRAAGITE